jgi:Mg-chelatase subunit ChlD
MNRFISSKRSSRVRRSLVVLFVFCSLLPVRSLLAQGPVGGPIQNTPTSLTSTADQVNKEGYSLKPVGLATNEWPILKVDFSIERADRTIFKNLTAADIETKIDGKNIAVREGDLKEKDDQGVFVVLDGSGSMAMAGVDKLSAAKQGVKKFIDNLDANDKVGLIAFDEEPRLIVPPTTDKERVKQEVESFTIRPGKSKYTGLYDAVDYGLARARENGINNLLLISDGWEDTLATQGLSPEAMATLKREREQRITRFSRDNNIRVFTVAIGDENGKGLTYVDRKALDNISKGANGGVASYIELKGEVEPEALEKFLQSSFQQIVNDLKQWFQYSYSLTLRVVPSQQAPGQDHKLWVGFTVGDNPRIQLPIEYTYALQAAGAPVVSGVTQHAAIFIRTAPRTVTWLQLLFIYFALLFGLVILGLIPSVAKTLSRGTEAVRLRKSVVALESRSPLLGLACPNEGNSAKAYLFKEGDIVLVCPACRTPHHLSCWILHQHQCMQRNCLTELMVPEAMLERHGLTERNLREETSWMTS